jgi:hypothetical protein
MLPRWFFLIFGQGGQCKLHWPQNLAALPKDGAVLASQRGGSHQIAGPCPPRATGGRSPRSGALPAGRRPRVARPAGPRRPDPPPAGAGGARVGPGSACGGLPRVSPDLAPPPGPGPARPAGAVGEGVGGWPPPLLKTLY